MKHRIDPLIQDRAPWLFENRPGMALMRAVLNQILTYRRTLEIGDALKDMSADDIMTTMGALLARNVTVSGLRHLPGYGPALIVANHPTGIADGIILHHVLRQVRPDIYYFANHDILRVLPQMREMIAPVEWRRERRSFSKTRTTMDVTRKAVDAGRLGVIFPSGRLAKRQGIGLQERPWMASAAMIARRFDLPVIPVHIQARNSVMYYLLDRIHPSLRDITLFHETLNKARQPFEITIGDPISASALPAKSEDGIAMLRQATLDLATRKPALVSVFGTRQRPGRA